MWLELIGPDTDACERRPATPPFLDPWGSSSSFFLSEAEHFTFFFDYHSSSKSLFFSKFLFFSYLIIFLVNSIFCLHSLELLSLLCNQNSNC